MARQIQTSKRQVPIEQIIAVQGRNPLAAPVTNLGEVLGEALLRKEQLRREGQQLAMQQRELAKLEQLSGQQPGSFEGLSPSTATSFANKLLTQRSDAYTPEQMRALQSNDPDVISQAFQGRVPKEAASLASTYGSKKLNRENLEEDRKGRRDERLAAAAIGYWKTLETNPVIKTLKQQDIGLSQVDALVSLVSSGNTVAANALGTKMARGMGEVGVLTDTDVLRYVQSGQLTRAAGDKLSRMLKGIPTQATLDEMKEIISVLRNSYSDKIQPLYNDAVERFATNYSLDPEEASKRLVIPYTKGRGLPTLQSPQPRTITPKKAGRFIIEEE